MAVPTLLDAVTCTGGTLLTDGGGSLVSCVVKSPNRPVAGCLYVQFESNGEEARLLPELRQAGAAGVVVRSGTAWTLDEWERAGIGVIAVPSVADAYYRLAAGYRSRFDIPVVQVIGSSGKTTTKEMVGAALRELGPVLTTYENLNAPLGVAIQLFRLREGHHRAAVLEAGMSGRGHILRSTTMVRPSIGIVTCIHRAHLLRLGSMEAIIRAKAEMLEQLDPAGCLILNGDDANCALYPVHQYAGRVIRYGFAKTCDVRASQVEMEGEWTHFTATGSDYQVACRIHTFGRYQIRNALAALIAGIEAGLTPEQAAKGLESYEPAYARLQTHAGRHGMTLIDDNFNANPDSTRMLLEEIGPFAKDRPLVLVLGDMERGAKESEAYARSVHEEIGRQLATLTFHRVLTVGKWAPSYVEGARQAGVDPAKIAAFAEPDQAREHLLASVTPGCVVVFKASVYTDLHDLLDLLK